MEQKMNSVQELDAPADTAAWRGIGGLAAGWVARAQAQRAPEAEAEDDRFVPVAWAAE